MGIELQPRGVGTPPAIVPASAGIDEGPFGWIQQSPLRTWLLLRGLKLFAISVGLAAALAVLAVMLISAGLAQALSAFPAAAPGSVSPSQGPTTDQLVGAFLVILGFFFFTAQVAPYGLDFSVASLTAYGVGSLLIPSVIIVLAYRSGRRSQRLFPTSKSNFESAVRAASMAVPYCTGSLILFLVSSLHAQIPFVGNVNVGPSALGLFTPLLLVGGSAALGAVRQRTQPLSASSVYAVRGAVLALFSIATGIIGVVVGAIVAVVLSQISNTSTFQSTSTFQGSPAPSYSGTGAPTTPSPNALGAGVLVLAVLVGIFYIPNGLLWLWGNALGLNLASGGWILLAFGVAGALVGALAVRPRPGGTEQISYAVTFGVASFVLAFVSRPTVGSYAWGGNPWIVLGFGLVLGAALAIAGPFVALSGLGRTTLSLPLVRFAFARLPLPQLGQAGPLPPGPSVFVQPQPAALSEQPVQINLPSIHFGRRAKIVAGLMVALFAAGIAGNIYASSLTTPEAAALAYVDAVGTGNVDAIWSRTIVTVPQAQQPFMGPGVAGDAPQLITKADLKSMMALPQNSHQARSGISATSVSVRGDAATVAVSYSEQGQRRTETLNMQRDRGQNQYLLYPNWKVVKPAGIISMNVPSAESMVTIDGASLPKGVNSAIVLPGAHKITLLASGPFAGKEEFASVAPGAYNQIGLRPDGLTTAAQAAAAQTVRNYFTSCLQRTDAYPGDCPQRLDFYVATPIHWQLVGEPTDGLKVNVDPNSAGIQAGGHFLMTAEVTTDNGTEHRLSGGPFVLGLTWDGQTFKTAGLGYYYDSPTPLANPGGDQSAILDSVKAGWQTCLKATSITPPDCPARPSAYGPTSVKWTSTTDPMAGAIISWDGSVGVYKVTGNYSLAVNYSDSFGTAQEQTVSGGYTADVIWSGQKAQLIHIG